MTGLRQNYGELGRGYDEKGEQEGSEKKKHSGIISFRERRQKLKKNGFQQMTYCRCLVPAF